MTRRPGRRPKAPSALAFAGLLVLGGCGFEPAPAPMSFSLAPATIEATRASSEVRARIATSLESLFGTPSDPRYAADPTWTTSGIDPNHPDQPAPAGSGELDAARLAVLRDANRVAFAHALGRIDAHDVAGAADEVRRRAPDLSAALIASEQAASEQRARALVESWYPSLRESAEVYRQECLQCHGVEGGGDGPNAFYLVPRPRDFRKGIFKYTALKDQSRPRREDLLRTLDEGIPGTSMPNYQRLSAAQRAGLADYVRFLAIRGEVESSLVARWQEEDELAPGAESEELASVWDKWLRAPQKLVVFDGAVPPSTPERIARGDQLFHDPLRGNCASCHGAEGRGDGAAAYKIDVHGNREPAYLDAWGFPITPRNLRDGMFRGGSRPIDVYRRIYAGIPGGPMPALGETVDARGAPLLTSDDLWCLVHYVRHLAHAPEEP